MIKKSFSLHGIHFFLEKIPTRKGMRSALWLAKRNIFLKGTGHCIIVDLV